MYLRVTAVVLVALLGSFIHAQAQDDVDITTEDAILEHFGDDAVMYCRPDGDVSTQPIIWKKDGTTIVDTEDKYVTSPQNKSLTVKSVMPEDVGEYECVVELGGGQSFNRSVNLFSGAYVNPFEKSKNLVQGDPLVLDCKVAGHPTPKVSWFKDEKPLDTGDERITLKANTDGIENGTLRINQLDFDDRADYACLATNYYGNTNSTILVRVKDKLAALWPFLGICAEVAILVVIIFIYERKRAKKLEEMEAKEEADHLTNSHSHKGGDDVRQRK